MFIDELKNKKDVKVYRDVLDTFNLSDNSENTLYQYRQACLVIVTHHVACELIQDGYVQGHAIPELPMTGFPYVDNSLMVVEDTMQFIRFAGALIFDDVNSGDKLHSYVEDVVLKTYRKFDENSKLNRIINRRME